MVADYDLRRAASWKDGSKSRFWENSLVIAVEDDAQDGADHISSRRTLALFAGPMVRRGALDERFDTQIELVRTIQDIFRIEPRTRFMAESRAMSSILTAAKDTRLYLALPSKLKLDDMNPPVKALNGQGRRAGVESAKMNWDEVDDVPADVLNRILCEDRKGWGTTYPVRRAGLKK